MKEGIEINFDLISDYIAEELAAATYAAVRRFVEKPGGREFLEKKKAERKQRKAYANQDQG